ncbi:MAG: ATP synthase F1 subunit delta [Pyrinomonadaceae bacterium]
MSVETIARRYAGALADVAQKSGNVETVVSEIEAWVSMFKENRELADAFGNPAIAHLNKEKVLESLIERTKPSLTTANFLRVLLQNSRITELAQISDKLAAVLEERSGVVSGSVLSSRELTEAEKNGFVENLGKATGKKVKLTFEIDENILGGAITRVGSTVFDGSVRSQLESLQSSMIKN